MKCTSPYILKQEPYEGVPVPCRNCLACRITRSSEWAMRINHEFLTWEHGCFITLTYDEEHLPENKSLVKKDLQKFFKRLRYHLGKKRRIKYFACGEYGDKRKRPHYHAIILGISMDEHKLEQCPKNGYYVLEGPLKESWDKGIIHVGEVNNDTIGYVTHYIDKKMTGKLAEEQYEGTGRRAPFQLQSQGFGLDYALKNEAMIKENLFILHKNKKKPIPNYYRQKLDIKDDPRFKEMAIENEIKELKEYIARNKSIITAERFKLYEEVLYKKPETAIQNYSQIKMWQREDIENIHKTIRDVRISQYEAKKQQDNNLKAKYERGKEYFDDIF